MIIGWIKISGKSYWINANSWGHDVGGSYMYDGIQVDGLFFIPFGYPFKDAWVVKVGELPDPEPIPTTDNMWCKLGRFFLQLGGCSQSTEVKSVK